MVGGACMDGYEWFSGGALVFLAVFVLLPGRFVPAGGGCFCFPGGLCLRKVFSLAFSGLACRAYAGGVLEGELGVRPDWVTC
jgi:hypothetical protein